MGWGAWGVWGGMGCGGGLTVYGEPQAGGRGINKRQWWEDGNSLHAGATGGWMGVDIAWWSERSCAPQLHSPVTTPPHPTPHTSARHPLQIHPTPTPRLLALMTWSMPLVASTGRWGWHCTQLATSSSACSTLRAQRGRPAAEVLWCGHRGVRGARGQPTRKTARQKHNAGALSILANRCPPRPGTPLARPLAQLAHTRSARLAPRPLSSSHPRLHPRSNPTLQPCPST